MDFVALAEYGIAIFSVGSALGVIFWIVRLTTNAQKENSEVFRDTVKDLSDKHSEEREHWNALEDKRVERSDRVLSELSQAIRESIEVSRQQMRGPE